MVATSPAEGRKKTAEKKHDFLIRGGKTNRPSILSKEKGGPIRSFQARIEKKKME